MGQVLSMLLTTDFAFSILRISTPLVFAGMAALVSERAGVVNIAIEGIMLSAALGGVVASAATQSWVVGLASGVALGVVLSLVLAYFHLSLGANIIMCGLAINVLAKGGTIFVLYMLTGQKGASTALASVNVPDVALPGIGAIPVLGQVLSGQNLLTYLALVAVVALHVLVFHTRMGLHITAVGQNPGAVSSVGVSVLRTRYAALLISGVLAGLAGCFMSMGYMNGFTANMTAGRGFIGLAANSMGANAPIGTLVAALVFGVADAASNYLQMTGVPAQFVQMLPYATTLVGIAVWSMKKAGDERRRRRRVAVQSAQRLEEA